MRSKSPNRVIKSFSNVLISTTKGVATGASIAGIVNTVAPGAIPTFCGYLVGKGFGDLLVQAGLITLGIFAQPAINAVAILGVSGIIGGVFGGAIGLAKEIRRGIKEERRRIEQGKYF